MKNLLFKFAVLLCVLAASSSAVAVSHTFSSDDSTGQCRVFLNDGIGRLTLTGTFGSGTITLQALKEGALDKSTQSNWYTTSTYTAVPSPNPVTMDYGAPTWVQVILSGSTSPDLYCEIVAGSRG